MMFILMIIETITQINLSFVEFDLKPGIRLSKTVKAHTIALISSTLAHPALRSLVFEW